MTYNFDAAPNPFTEKGNSRWENVDENNVDKQPADYWDKRQPWIHMPDGNVWLGEKGMMHGDMARIWKDEHPEENESFDYVRQPLGHMVEGEVYGLSPSGRERVRDVEDTIGNGDFRFISHDEVSKSNKQFYEEQAHKFRKMVMGSDIQPLKDQIKANLTPDLLKPGFGPGAHCYVASEALWHLLGGKASGYTPMNMPVGGVQHWWLRGPDGTPHDITADQFDHPVDYSAGRGRGFMTAAPSKRAQIVIDRVNGNNPESLQWQHSDQPLADPRTSAAGDKWVYLNGKVGFGNQLHDIAFKLGNEQRLPDAMKIANLVAAGIYPATHHDLAFGSWWGNHPQIYISNVHRSTVQQAVREAIRGQSLDNSVDL